MNWTDRELDREARDLATKWLAMRDQEVVDRIAHLDSVLVSLAIAGMVMGEVCRVNRQRGIDFLHAVTNPTLRSCGGVPYGEQYVDITCRVATQSMVRSRYDV